MCRNVQMFLKFITENSRQRKRFFEVYLPPTSVIALRSHHRPEEGDEPAHEAVDEEAQLVEEAQAPQQPDHPQGAQDAHQHRLAVTCSCDSRYLLARPLRAYIHSYSCFSQCF